MCVVHYVLLLRCDSIMCDMYQTAREFILEHNILSTV